MIFKPSLFTPFLIDDYLNASDSNYWTISRGSYNSTEKRYEPDSSEILMMDVNGTWASSFRPDYADVTYKTASSCTAGNNAFFRLRDTDDGFLDTFSGLCSASLTTGTLSLDWSGDRDIGSFVLTGATENVIVYIYKIVFYS